MAEEVENGVELLSSKSPSTQTNDTWKQEMEQGQSQLERLQARLLEVKTCFGGLEENRRNKELEIFRRRVKDTAALLTNMELKARTISIPDLADQEGLRLVGNNIKSLTNGSKDANLTSSDSLDEETQIQISNMHQSVEYNDRYIRDLLKTLRMISDVVDVLVKMVIVAETETAMEKEKVSLGQEEIRRKVLQIENMSVKVEEMEIFAHGTNRLLNEMQQKVEDMVQESSRQRQRATENEQELCRVKQDFEALRTYVSSLISVREMLLSSEKHQTSEMSLERSIAMVAHLQGENGKKDAEVKKLMAENVRLSAQLDKKEAQLIAMNEQCKVMALHDYGI